MAVVETIKDGEATIVFHDDYCKDTTPEEVDRIMKHIAQITLPHMIAAMEKEKEQKEKTG